MMIYFLILLVLIALIHWGILSAFRALPPQLQKIIHGSLLTSTIALLVVQVSNRLSLCYRLIYDAPPFEFYRPRAGLTTLFLHVYDNVIGQNDDTIILVMIFLLYLVILTTWNRLDIKKMGLFIVVVSLIFMAFEFYLIGCQLVGSGPQKFL